MIVCINFFHKSIETKIKHNIHVHVHNMRSNEREISDSNEFEMNEEIYKNVH